MNHGDEFNDNLTSLTWCVPSAYSFPLLPAMLCTSSDPHLILFSPSAHNPAHYGVSNRQSPHSVLISRPSLTSDFCNGRERLKMLPNDSGFNLVLLFSLLDRSPPDVLCFQAHYRFVLATLAYAWCNPLASRPTGSLLSLERFVLSMGLNLCSRAVMFVLVALGVSSAAYLPQSLLRHIILAPDSISCSRRTRYIYNRSSANFF